jgi:tRNA dimethylallyltransferase
MGATAGGKTSLAAHLAKEINGEIISADSRQVYKRMNIGTGKDLADFVINGKKITFHLIDIAEPGEKYNVYEYQKDFLNVYYDILKRGKLPIICGGSGMYIDAVLKGYRLINVPTDDVLRYELEKKTDEELENILKENKQIHNISDTSNRKRLIRAVEISEYYKTNEQTETFYPKINSLNIQIVFDRNARRKRITDRLNQRFQEGMIKEVENLLTEGVPPETLVYYGLEYKFITQFIMGELSYSEMVFQLNTAIHQFSKRQMTWFRKMETDGHKIYKIDGFVPLEDKIEKIKNLYNS